MQSDPNHLSFPSLKDEVFTNFLRAVVAVVWQQVNTSILLAFYISVPFFFWTCLVVLVSGVYLVTVNSLCSLKILRIQTHSVTLEEQVLTSQCSQCSHNFPVGWTLKFDQWCTIIILQYYSDQTLELKLELGSHWSHNIFPVPDQKLGSNQHKLAWYSILFRRMVHIARQVWLAPRQRRPGEALCMRFSTAAEHAVLRRLRAGAQRRPAPALRCCRSHRPGLRGFSLQLHAETPRSYFW